MRMGYPVCGNHDEHADGRELPELCAIPIVHALVVVHANPSPGRVQHVACRRDYVDRPARPPHDFGPGL